MHESKEFTIGVWIIYIDLSGLYGAMFLLMIDSGKFIVIILNRSHADFFFHKWL